MVRSHDGHLPTSSIHRSLLPEKFVEHYTRGTWFKASFLHVFTWLALTFLLTNAPFADIVAPQVDDGWGMISSTEEGFEFTDESRDKVYLTEGYTGMHYLVLSFSDNYDASDSEYSITFNGDAANNSWAVLSESNPDALDSVRSHKDVIILLQSKFLLDSLLELTRLRSKWSKMETHGKMRER